LLLLLLLLLLLNRLLCGFLLLKSGLLMVSFGGNEKGRRTLRAFSICWR
jgi:hypothetical protein